MPALVIPAEEEESVGEIQLQTPQVENALGRTETEEQILRGHTIAENTGLRVD